MLVVAGYGLVRGTTVVLYPPPTHPNDAVVVVAGLCLYSAFIGRLHLWLIGVSPRCTV